MNKTMKVILAVCGVCVAALATWIVCALGLPKRAIEKVKDLKN